MFEIKKAVRIGTPAIIMLWSMSGGGKTLTALLMARGLVGPKGRVGLIDTENSRALIYADAEGVGDWYHMDFQPPFTPERYIEAIEYFRKEYKLDCLIVDSGSHEWEGEGGVIEMADNGKTARGKPLTGLAKWMKPKASHKRFVNSLLRVSVHVILCLRAKDGSEQTGQGSDTKIVNTGLKPISEKGLIYEATVSVLLGPDHKPLFKNIGRLTCDPMIPAIKIPEEIKHIIKPGEFIGVKTGEEIAKWIAGGEVFDEALAELRKVARDVSHLGTVSLKKHWESIGPTNQLKLVSIKADLKKTAADADEQNKAPDADEDQGDENQPDQEATSSLDD